MKFTYLGTAAAEGFPAVFCNCGFCNFARKNGGKNIRTRSQAIVNSDLLIDLPADTYMHFLNNGICGHKIKYLLVTHSHPDHFYYSELLMRNGAFAHNMEAEILEVFCGEGVYNKVIENGVPENVRVTKVLPFKPFGIGEYNITALPARHFEGDGALIYIIEQQGKRMLYAHDTGYFFDELFDYFTGNKIRFDMVSLDCTNADIPKSDTGSHMGFDNIGRLLEKLKNDGVVDEKTIVYVNHFSHNGNPEHSLLCQKAKKLGAYVSYDGCTVNI